MNSRSPIRAILFDKDGTLIDYQKSWEPTNRKAAAFAAAGEDAFARRLMQLGGMDPDSGITRADSLLAAGNTREIAEAWVSAGSPHTVEALVPALDELFIAAVADAVPVTDLAALFAELRREGFVLGIASSDSEAAIRQTLRIFRIEEYVAFVAGYDSGYGAKPAPGMLHGFSTAISIPPSEIAMVGDNLHDMEMARRGGAGLRIGVLTGTGRRETLAPAADLCLASIAALAGGLPAAVPA